MGEDAGLGVFTAKTTKQKITTIQTTPQFTQQITTRLHPVREIGYIKWRREEELIFGRY